MIVFSLSTVAIEPVFTSPRGFSITPPDGWAVASKETIGQIRQAAQTAVNSGGKADFGKMLEKLNLDKMAVFIFNAQAGTTAQNINVVVSSGQFPIDQAGSEQTFAKMLTSQYGQAGVTPSKLIVSHRTFGHHTTLVADMEWSISGSSVHQWQVLMPASNQTFIVTCTAPPSDFEALAPVFTHALDSMTYSSGGASPLLRGVASSMVSGGLIGAGIGVCMWLASRFKRSRGKA
jgi:hypothetical protein